ncbi:unnamed protein product [Soboliphyme baturini]|uniref:Protein EFR3-like protein n=1 Tax=Soboliphyme baturini TaxID=241478 RepID=A0A183IMS2_9BILA|nr:unnamed protein product [Soboliphyme baturini]
MSLLCCCSACQPRYRRLVDSIYPSLPENGLVKLNMQKLTFYAISHPEKLDRIGGYLVTHLSRDIYRQRIGYVRVAVEAMDQLLAACHGSPSLNLFVESFLKMVQRLYETQSVELELLGTESFVTFANIEEDAPSYYRRYDFFICKFCSLCHYSSLDMLLMRKMRCAGIKGIRGVVRKTVNDELQANIWEKQHMEKIVPSLLFNMHDGSCPTPVADSCETDASALKVNMTANGSEDSPFTLADACLRELVSKATFGNIKSVLGPTLSHCDYHKLWVPPSFAVTCLEAIMYSIQSQYGYVVIQSVLEHLDTHSDDDPEVRIGIATALSRLVVIAASASIGPCLLEIFNSMLRHLRQSVELESSGAAAEDTSEAEKTYQEILINTMGNFTVHLPDYQKVEIMVFIIGKVRTLLKVSTTYRAGHFSMVFTNPFLVSLLQLACVEESNVRLVVHRILHTLLDRHQNLELLESMQWPRDAKKLHLTLNRFTKTDVIFIRKNCSAIFSALYKSTLMANNTSDNYDAIFYTLALILIEIGSEDMVIDLFRLCLAIQGAAYDSSLHLGVTQVVSSFSNC